MHDPKEGEAAATGANTGAKRRGSANMTILALILAAAAVGFSAWTVFQVRALMEGPESEITTETNYAEIRQLQKRVQYLEDVSDEGKKALFDSIITQIGDTARYLSHQDLNEEQLAKLREALKPVTGAEEAAPIEAPAADEAVEAPAQEAAAAPAEEAAAPETATETQVEEDAAAAEQAEQAPAEETPAQEAVETAVEQGDEAHAAETSPAKAPETPATQPADAPAEESPARSE